MAKKTIQRLSRAAVRRQRALEMRIAGSTLREIAAELEVAQSTVCNTLQTALRHTNAQTASMVEEYRRLSNERFDKLIKALMPKAEKGSAQAAEAVRRIEVSRHKIMGTGAPQKFEVDGEIRVAAVPIEAVHEKIEARIEAEVEKRLNERLTELGVIDVGPEQKLLKGKSC